MEIKKIEKKDINEVLELNNNNLPAVSELTTASIESLLEMSLHAFVIRDDLNKLAGFCIILSPNQNYKSDNYRWVSEHYKDFQYLDRVVITDGYRGQGLGRKLYEHWFKLSNSKPLLLEVNVKPRNEESILFHEKMGFNAVGEQDTEGGKKRVQYMEFKQA